MIHPKINSYTLRLFNPLYVTPSKMFFFCEKIYQRNKYKCAQHFKCQKAQLFSANICKNNYNAIFFAKQCQNFWQKISDTQLFVLFFCGSQRYFANKTMNPLRPEGWPRRLKYNRFIVQNGQLFSAVLEAISSRL